MRQLLLNWGMPAPQTLANFVTGSNVEALALLHKIAGNDNLPLSERFIYLWGDKGAGKTHLLTAMAALPSSRLITAQSTPVDFLFDTETRLYLLDDCDLLSPEQQIAAFALFNEARDKNGILIATGPRPPASLAVREDLRTRFGWGLIYQLHGLSDDEKIDALTQAAQSRGLTLSAGVIPYLITHFRRDMPSLSGMLEALDRYSLETKRPITLPLLRELLQLEQN
ncbi:MAG: hypothetical protein K0S28_455 [Paucimonas sp.]|jgi:DnaA family protein|nr:hypothetical protein [Paucimonas sp.]